MFAQPGDVTLPLDTGKHDSSAPAQPQQGGAAHGELEALQALQQQQEQLLEELRRQQERDQAAVARQHAQQQQRKGRWRDRRDPAATAHQRAQQQQWQAAPAASGTPILDGLPVTQGRPPLHAGAQHFEAAYPEEDEEGQDWWHCGHASWDAAQYSIAADATARKPARMLHYGPQQAGLSRPTQAHSEVPHPFLTQGQMKRPQQPSIAELAGADRAWQRAAALEGHAGQHVTCRGSAHGRQRRAGKRPPWDDRFVAVAGQTAAGSLQRGGVRGSDAGGLSKQHGQGSVPQRWALVICLPAVSSRKGECTGGWTLKLRVCTGLTDVSMLGRRAVSLRGPCCASAWPDHLLSNVQKLALLTNAHCADLIWCPAWFKNPAVPGLYLQDSGPDARPPTQCYSCQQPPCTAFEAAAL